MHVFIPIVALLGLAAAQSDDTTSTAASSTNSAASATSSVTSCIAACDEADVNCKAACVNVPAPNESMIMATNECSRNECSQVSQSFLHNHALAFAVEGGGFVVKHSR